VTTNIVDSSILTPRLNKTALHINNTAHSSAAAALCSKFLRTHSKDLVLVVPISFSSLSSSSSILSFPGCRDDCEYKVIKSDETDLLLDMIADSVLLGKWIVVVVVAAAAAAAAAALARTASTTLDTPRVVRFVHCSSSPLDRTDEAMREIVVHKVGIVNDATCVRKERDCD
jgi:hypothetical protein